MLGECDPAAHAIAQLTILCSDDGDGDNSSHRTTSSCVTSSPTGSATPSGSASPEVIHDGVSKGAVAGIVVGVGEPHTTCCALIVSQQVRILQSWAFSHSSR